MLFSKKWLRNHPQFLLHFLIHIDVLMLCRKFELIRTKTSGVMIIFKNNTETTCICTHVHIMHTQYVHVHVYVHIHVHVHVHVHVYVHVHVSHQ